MIEDIELRDMLRGTAQDATLPSVMPEPLRRKVKVRRARTIGVTFLVTLAIIVGGLQGMRAVTLDEAAPEAPAGRRNAGGTKLTVMIDRNIQDITPDAPAPKVPYLIDLNTRDMTPLPESITRSLANGRFNRFAVSPDGTTLAFVGEGDEGTPQIFIAGIDGTGLRQLTHDPKGAVSSSWSPDGTRIAYEGYGSGDGVNVFVLDVASGESRQITPENPLCSPPCVLNPQFTPDGSSIIYNGAHDPCCNATVRTVPVAGGRSTLLIGPGDGLYHVGNAVNASLSPDGSLVTFFADGSHCGPCRFLVSADGSDKRVITGWYASPSGAWSPDGTRIVLADQDETAGPPFIGVVDVATGETVTVAEGRAAVWLDDHTLLVDWRGR